MKRLRLYYVGIDEWGVMCSHYSAREAKRLAYRAVLDLDASVDYIDVSVSLIRTVSVPSDVTEPEVYDSCNDAPWTCLAWTYMDDCYGCRVGVRLGKTDLEAGS